MVASSGFLAAPVSDGRHLPDACGGADRILVVGRPGPVKVGLH